MNKKVWKVVTCLACMTLIVGCIFGMCACSKADVTITLNTSKKYQTFDGFGASSAWTYQLFGASENTKLKDDTMEAFYGNSGLALNTFRYNVGAGGSEVYTYKDKERGAESFFVAENFNADADDPYSVFADESNYDFTRDKAVRELFDKALSLGNIKEVVFFANSPHYLMTSSGKAHGSKENQNNLKANCYEAFSKYMLVIVNRLYKDIVCKYDKDIKILISPVNEPQWKWGGSGVTQEGCHYDPKQLAKFYDVFYKELKAFNTANSTSFIMDVFESGNYDMLDSSTKFKRYIENFQEYDWFKDLDCISVHSYGTNIDVKNRNQLQDYIDKNISGKKVSVSEYCVMEGGTSESIDMGIYSAQVVLRDLAMINAVSWNYWLSLSLNRYDFEDGLLYWDEKDTVWSTRRYYTIGQFSKYITRGSVRVQANCSGVDGVECVAFTRPDGAMVLVVINNTGSDQKIAIKGGYKNIQEIVTTQTKNWETSNYKYKKSVTSSAKSVTTYVMTK